MIQLTLDNRIAILTMEADGRNAMSADDLHTLAQHVRTLSAAGTADGLILTGANHSFCSGLMYHPEADRQTQLDLLFPALEEALIALRECRLPLVCVATGHAIGAGFLMLAAADAVFMTTSPKAKFGLPEVMLDLFVSPVMVDTLRMRFAEWQIRRLLFAGSYVSSATLADWGIVDALADDDSQLLTLATAYIARLAPHLPSVGICKDHLLHS